MPKAYGDKYKCTALLQDLVLRLTGFSIFCRWWVAGKLLTRCYYAYFLAREGVFFPMAPYFMSRKVTVHCFCPRVIMQWYNHQLRTTNSHSSSTFSKYSFGISTTKTTFWKIHTEKINRELTYIGYKFILICLLCVSSACDSEQVSSLLSPDSSSASK